MTPTKPNTERVGLTPEQRRDPDDPLTIKVSNWLLRNAPESYEIQSSYSRRVDAEELIDLVRADMLKNPPEELNELLEACRNVSDAACDIQRIIDALKAFDESRKPK